MQGTNEHLQDANREVMFILHNWEGDWLMRGGTGADAYWTKESIPAGVVMRSHVKISWFKVRQAGANGARAEIGKTKCMIYHATEVNKVLDYRKDIPCLTS